MKAVWIIGAGVAGLSAALTLARHGQESVLVSSAPSVRAQSVMAEGGINAALDTKGQGDSMEEHFRDTMEAGCDLADPNAVRALTEGAAEVVRTLARLGVAFNRTEGGALDLRYFGGQKKKRTAFAQSSTGRQVMAALIQEARRWEDRGLIRRKDHHEVVKYLTRGQNECTGCIILDKYTKSCEILSGTGLLASGGLNGLFGRTTGAVQNTGAAAAAAYLAGAACANLEMIQYHPTTAAISGKRALLSEAARGEGGRLFVLRDGIRWYYMEEKYPELGNLMPRDITAREIWKISKESPVYLDMTEIPKDVTDRKLAGLVSDCQIYLHKDIRKEPVQVVPGIHYFMGGIYVDEKHRTPVRNLYAAGECCAQYHGANRLGGNSLLGAIYGGRIAAQTACEDAMTAKDMLVTETQELADLCESISQPDKKKINKIMLNTLGVVRNRKRMEEELEKLCQIKGSLSLLGQAAIMSAIERTESRGAHYREDYPKKNDDFARTTIASYNGQKIQIHFEEIPERRQ